MSYENSNKKLQRKSTERIIPDTKSIWSQLGGVVQLCLPATSSLLKAMFGGPILIKSYLTSVIDGYPMFLCPILNSEIASRTEMKDILFRSVFSLLPLHAPVAW